MPNSSEKKKSVTAGKFGAFVFWNAGIIHTEFMHLGTITEMNTYYDMLWCLHQAIHRKRIGHLSRDVILDNSRPHSTKAEEFLWAFQLLDNPPCSPNLVLSYYHLFGLLKQHLGDHRLHNMRMWKWLFTNGCKCKSLISTEMGFLHSHQDGIKASVCSGIMLKNKDTSAE